MFHLAGAARAHSSGRNRTGRGARMAVGKVQRRAASPRSVLLVAIVALQMGVILTFLGTGFQPGRCESGGGDSAADAGAPNAPPPCPLAQPLRAIVEPQRCDLRSTSRVRAAPPAAGGGAEGGGGRRPCYAPLASPRGSGTAVQHLCRQL